MIFHPQLFIVYAPFDFLQNIIDTSIYVLIINTLHHGIITIPFEWYVEIGFEMRI